MRTWIPLALLLAACGAPPDDTGSAGCVDPVLWYPPDPPADDMASVYFGCDPPRDWTTDPGGAPTTGTPAGTPTGRGDTGVESG